MVIVNKMPHNQFKNKMSAIPAKNKMCATEKENKASMVNAKDRMSMVETKNRMCAVEGDNSPNSERLAPHQNHPPIAKPKSKTEIGFPIQIPFVSLDMTALQLFCAVLFNIIVIIGKTF